MEFSFEKFVELKWKDALNMAATEPVSWGLSMPKLEKTILLTRKTDEAKVSSADATGGWGGGGIISNYNRPVEKERGKVLIGNFHECTGMHLSMCLFCLRESADQDGFKWGTDRKPVCPMPEYLCGEASPSGYTS
jgi:hypothetical protein